ncbi:hypothetical protein DFP73DRAFT_577626 [Morchella snyderi]|nr:hypothetical protein DFP73DRAFT_577626 [Morchella snyderi]
MCRSSPVRKPPYDTAPQLPQSNRSLGRDVHIYDANDPAAELGVSFSLTVIFTLTNELWLVRTILAASGTCTDAVRERDGRCVITGEEAANAVGTWTGFQAAHSWLHLRKVSIDYGRWITISPAIESAGSINSVQNGMLLRADSHALLDSYKVAINPADNYKIACFNTDRKGIAGKHLDQQLLEDPRRPVDELLDMKGAEELVFEFDLLPGSDMIMEGPKAAQRMEYELFSRLICVK